ncbi:MAG TPA: hypothetical protein VF035_01560 [Longimicrobiales bacterium]
MTILVQTVLMLFAASAFAGAAACVAVGQQRGLQEGCGNPGMSAVAVLLSVFASLCAGGAGGPAAILAVALPIGLAGYAFAARRCDLFRIQTAVFEADIAEGSELHT